MDIARVSLRGSDQALRSTLGDYQMRQPSGLDDSSVPSTMLHGDDRPRNELRPEMESFVKFLGIFSQHYNEDCPLLDYVVGLAENTPLPGTAIPFMRNPTSSPPLQSSGRRPQGRREQRCSTYTNH